MGKEAGLYQLIRNVEELRRGIRYVLNNPEKAGIKNCPWVYCIADPLFRISNGLEKGNAGL